MLQKAFGSLVASWRHGVSAIIYNLLTSNNLDILALSETWHESSTSPSLLSSIPPNYTFLDVSRYGS